MGFADYSIAEIAEDYQISVEMVCQLCDRLGIHYQDIHTKLALEDAKTVILAAQTAAQTKEKKSS